MSKLLLLLLPCASICVQVAPTWITSTYVKASSNSIISTLTGNSSTPSATLTFSSAFSAAPNLAYGILNYEGNLCKYEGDDFMGD
jgi:hypothetical protein